MRFFWLCAALLMALAGCTDPPAQPPKVQATRAATANPTFMGDDADPDVRPQMPMIVHLTVYQISVPLHTVSANETFWKHVDEQTIDPPSYRRLRANGVRVGLARDDDWDYFRDILTKNPVVATMANSATLAQGTLEMPLQTGITSEDIFYFNNNGDLVGRSYDLCEHAMAISFQALERQPGVVRVELCPVIRAQRESIQVTEYEGERQFKYVRPERYYDLNLRADVPLEHFMIVAPAPEASWPTSIGQRFLLQERRSALEETVLVLAPKPFRLGTDATQPTTRRATTIPAPSYTPRVTSHPPAAPRR